MMHNRRRRQPWVAASMTMMILAATTAPALARTQLKNICRLKGQEENVLRGFGLVVGLNGTGEVNDLPTMLAMARSMELMGHSLATGGQPSNLDALRRMKNAAFVMVTATVPATGARRGDRIDCFVSAINGKSLAGGRLAFAALQGPNTQDDTVYALCEGQITIDSPTVPTVGVIHNGCQIDVDLPTPFLRDGYITLVLNRNHANFQTAASIVEELKRKQSLSYSEGGVDDEQIEHVKAIDARNIVIRIPNAYLRDPVAFASEVLDTTIYEHEPEARVIINPRAGSIVISGDLEIGDVIVTHKNVVVEAVTQGGFSQIDVDESSQPRLQQLVDQLNSLKVPTQDMIDIIQGIERLGKLHGQLIIE